VIARALLLGLVLATPVLAHADDRAALGRELDALIALQRQAGWTYWSPPGMRPRPLTFGLRWAEWAAAPLGMAGWDTIVLRSPGTPEAGLALLAGHRLRGRGEYLAAAQRAGNLLIALQLPDGGWFSEMPAVDRQLPAWFPWVVPGPSIDDDVTPGAVRLLLALWQATGEASYRQAAERGIDVLLAAQLPDGAWPLCVRRPWIRRLRPGFEDLPTLNDGATSAAIITLLAAARALERPELEAVARRGGAWLLQARGTPPQAGWAQQYDPDGRPAPGRRFELPALASWETRFALDALLALAQATGDRRWCAPVGDAVAWLERSALSPGCWARLYDAATNAPLYAAGSGGRVPDAAHARPGYSWRGDFGIPWLLARLGRTLPRGVTAAPLVAGDPGTCPGTAADAALPGDARAHIARASAVVARLEPAAPPVCR
jgi:hypothetical protein